MRFLTSAFILSIFRLVIGETYYGDHCTVTDFMHKFWFRFAELNHTSCAISVVPLPSLDALIVTPFEDKNVVYLQVLSDCENGSVYWNYPLGTALLNVTRPGQDFDFCIETSYATALGGVQLKTGVAKGPLLVPTEDNPTCIHSLHGEAAFILQSPPSMRYLTVFNYRIVSPD